MLKITDFLKEQAKSRANTSGNANNGGNGAKAPVNNEPSRGAKSRGSGNNPAPPAPPATPDVFDCLIKADSSIQRKANVTDYVLDNSLTGSTYIYWKDGDFSIKAKDDLSGVSKYTGKWKCDGDSFVIDTSDGDHYDSKTAKWSGVSSGRNGGGKTLVDTTLTGDDLKSGKSVKYGMKGDIVGKIQQFLIDKGYKNVSKSGKVDNIFGKRTKASVEEFQTNNGLTVDGAVGKDTWPKLNDPKAVTKGNATSTQTSNNNTPGADLQGKAATYVSGSDAQIFEKDIPGVLKESVKKILRKSLLKHIK